MYNEIIKHFSDKIEIPNELKQFCDWVEVNGYPISGYFELEADEYNFMNNWLGFPDVNDRFGLFGTDGSGSGYALWIDDSGVQKVVHLGSEGDELHILAHSFIDFLRLLAIGYDQLGCVDLNLTVEEWNIAIGDEPDDGLNPQFKHWVESTFAVTVPKRGREIIDYSDRSFEQWITQQLENNRIK